MSDPNQPKDPMAQLMETAISAGTNVIKVVETTIVTMVPVVGYTITAVIGVWGGKSVIMNVIELVDRAVDIQKN